MEGRFSDMPPLEDDERPAKPSPRDRFPLTPFNKIRLGTGPRYRVQGLLPIRGLAVAWGPPKCGKSFLMFDLLMHVALGWTYRGRHVEPGAVIYAALEGQTGFEARAIAFGQRHLETHDGDVPFYLMPASLSLVSEHADLIGAIRAQLPQGQVPAVVALDTLNRSFTGSESDDRDMTAYIRAADAIRDAFGCLVVIVHHSGLDGSRPRGHTALGGAVDAQLAIKKLGDCMVQCLVEFMKDGPAGDVMMSRLDSVQVGTDDRDMPITSLLVCPADESEAPPVEKPKKPLKPEHRLAFEALSEAIVSFGKPAPLGCGAPAGTTVVHRDHWRDELYRRGILDRKHTNPSTAYSRLRNALAAAAIIAERDEMIWVAKLPS